MIFSYENRGIARVFPSCKASRHMRGEAGRVGRTGSADTLENFVYSIYILVVLPRRRLRSVNLDTVRFGYIYK